VNAARLLAVLRIELGSLVRRPVLWVLVALLLLSSWGLADGGLTISSGDTQVGGTKAWVNSEFAIANALTFLVFLFYTFFIAVAAGMSVIRDDELQVGEVLHGTPLRPAEYIWGKFGANLLVFLLVLGLHMVSILFFFQFFPIANADEIRGPFVLGAYLRPAFYFALPMILFFAGTSFSIGERSRRPIIVFALPVAALLVCAFFLWSWSPSWLDPRINKLLMVLDPSGFRWLSETWLKVDRGVHFYNTQPIDLDLLFLANRLGFMGIALGAVALAQRHFATSLQGAKEAPRRWWRRRASRTEPADRPDPAPVVSPTTTPLAGLGMTYTRPTLLRGIVDVARIELQELRSQPGLYLFVPLILLQVLGTSLSAVGPFGTPVLLTAGNIGLGSINTLTLLVCLLLLFYTVESLERERSTGLAAMYYATPVRSASILFGKAVANSLVGLAIWWRRSSVRRSLCWFRERRRSRYHRSSGSGASCWYRPSWSGARSSPRCSLWCGSATRPMASPWPRSFSPATSSSAEP